MTASRQLLKSSAVDLLKHNGDRSRREIFLFNDMLLLAKGLGGGEEHKLKLVDQMPLDMILINIPVAGKRAYSRIHFGVEMAEDIGCLLQERITYWKSFTSTPRGIH